MRTALTTIVNGKKIFVGKIINDAYYREFPFSKAVLWQSKELSMDKRVLDVLDKNKIKWIVFTDTEKRQSYGIGRKEFENKMRVFTYGEGYQCYIKKDVLKHLSEYIETPYIHEETDLRHALYNEI